MAWMDLIPFIGLGILGMGGALIYLRFMQKAKQGNLVMLEEDIPKERQPFCFYSGEEDEGYHGRIFWRSSYQDSHTIKIANENTKGTVELSISFKKNIIILPYSDVLGGRITLACNVDAKNREHEWDTTRLEKLKQGLSEITVERIKNEERQELKKDVEMAQQLQPTRGRAPLPIQSEDINERFR